jgi:hypothetical protein
MLRWLVLGLLLCNCIYFFWARQSSFESAKAEAAPIVEGAHLALLSELKSSSFVGRSARESAEPTVNPPVPVCHMIGPFKEKISARQIKDRLQALNIEVMTYQLTIPEKPDYWVHLGPMRSRREALDMLRELQSKKIDSFLITEGELVNGLSLGFFTKEELARAVQKQRREQGYDAKVHQIPRFTLQLWEVFAGDQYGKFSEELWQKVKAGTDGLELRKNSCDLIASAERLD